MVSLLNMDIHNVESSNKKDETVKYLVFFMNGQLFGISSSNIIQVVGVGEMIAPYYSTNIINLRCDSYYDQSLQTIILAVKDKKLGLVVDQIEGVTDVRKSMILPPPTIEGTSIPYLMGVVKIKNKVTLLIDIHNLIDNQNLR